MAPGIDFAGERLDERRSYSVNDGNPTRYASNGVAKPPPALHRARGQGDLWWQDDERGDGGEESWSATAMLAWLMAYIVAAMAVRVGLALEVELLTCLCPAPLPADIFSSTVQLGAQGELVESFRDSPFPPPHFQDDDLARKRR